MRVIPLFYKWMNGECERGRASKDPEEPNKDFILVSPAGRNCLWRAALTGINSEGPSNILRLYLCLE